MFPDSLFLNTDLYWWMIIIGILAAMVSFRLFHKKAGLSAKVFNFTIVCAVVGIILGYVSAVLFQSWYAYLESGKFVWGVGATFYGGFIGAAVTVLAIYFGIGHFLFKDKIHILEFNRMLSLIMPCIALAHGFGRIGCLFAGCCYGAKTDAWYGISMYSDGEWATRVPIQLFEAIFLFALYFALMYLLVKKKCEYTTSIYLVTYGVWRFAIEFARNDWRGSSGIAFLTPSQLTAIVMVITGIALIFIYRYVLKNVLAKVGATE